MQRIGECNLWCNDVRVAVVCEMVMVIEWKEFVGQNRVAANISILLNATALPPMVPEMITEMWIISHLLPQPLQRWFGVALS